MSRFRPWRATRAERADALPGDDLIAEPASQTTRAITIRATASEVWPWLIQIGADRGGFYSYDWLENHFGFMAGGGSNLGIHSADEIFPAWQSRAVGDLVYADAKGTGGWYVMAVDAPNALVLKMADVKAGRPSKRDAPPAYWEFSWSFVLREQSDGTTRLIVRERTAFGKRFLRIVMTAVGGVSFLMTQKMLRGIRTRAERPDVPHHVVLRPA